MGADISRVRFDSHRDFSNVVLQQGRLLLDADFNETVAILDRRLRATALDVASFDPDPTHAGSAWVPRETPDGFNVHVGGGGALTIGRGRMYVDGVLAENHGIAPFVFDPVLAEATGTTDTPYDQQPYSPTPTTLPAGGPHLVYLDVWERELTALEDPSLVEVAVGVDTTARTQTAWQVRVLENVGGGVTCASADADIPGWASVIAPSAGRLSTGTVDVGPADDPCALPPTGGYRGLENQTYRVEVHDGGPAGTATFTWSRDNGSVATPAVEALSPTKLRIASVGRDDVLRISTDDWVEIVDDRYELAQRPGEMRKVTVDDAARTIEFTDALPADLVPANAAEAAARHLRVRRWDERGIVKDGTGAQVTDLDASGSNGVITVPTSSATEIQLEHGIVVSFSADPAGGAFRTGDHWVFAARTADTSVEQLIAAPPLGPHHHYARLALVTFPNTPTDCRRLWPPLSGGESDCGDCTVCVTAQSHADGSLTVQAAVAQVEKTGGTVCLGPGVYNVGDGITIQGARSLRLRGQGVATVLVARGTVLSVLQSMAVVVESMAIVSGAAAPSAVRLRGVVGCTIENVAVLSYRTKDATSSCIELTGVVAMTRLSENVLVGSVGISSNAGGHDNVALMAAGLTVRDNVVGARTTGVDLSGRSMYLLDVRVEDNDVVGATDTAVDVRGAVAPEASLCVSGNRIATDGVGIVVGVDASVARNVVHAVPQAGTSDGPALLGTDGIVVAYGDIRGRPGHVRITGNSVYDRAGVGVAVRAPVASVRVTDNILARVGDGVLVEERGRADDVVVAGNQVADVGAGRSVKLGAVFGIGILSGRRVVVADNAVVRVALLSPDVTLRAAIVVSAVTDARVAGNVIDGVGPPDGYAGLAAGIVAVTPFDRLAVTGNSVRRTGADAVGVKAAWDALLVGRLGQDAPQVAGRFAVVAVEGTGALAFSGPWASFVPAGTEHVTVAANAFDGGGARPTVLVRVRGDAVVDGNQCTHAAPGQPTGMLLLGSSVTVATNRVRGERAMVVLEVPENRFAAVGNLASGGVHLGGPGNGLPAPWGALNPLVP